MSDRCSCIWWRDSPSPALSGLGGRPHLAGNGPQHQDFPLNCKLWVNGQLQAKAPASFYLFSIYPAHNFLIVVPARPSTRLQGGGTYQLHPSSCLQAGGEADQGMSHYHLELSIRGSQHRGAGEEKGRTGRAEYRRPACSRCIITEQGCFLLATGTEAEIYLPRGSLAPKDSPGSSSSGQ